jgi:hypothetical protein
MLISFLSGLQEIINLMVHLVSAPWDRQIIFSRQVEYYTDEYTYKWLETSLE